MTTSDTGKKTAVWVIVAVLVALAAGALAGWYARSGEVNDLEDELAASQEAAEAADAEETATVPAEDADALGEPSGEAEPSEDGIEESEDEPAAAERVPAIVTSVRTEGTVIHLEVDYIQFLGGEEAADAATAHGDESPPPNDYYIVNDNPRLREFPVQAGINVITVVNDDGTSDPAGHTLTLTEWVDRITGPNAEAFKSSFYWITVTDATITTIEQQYLP